MCAVDKPPRPRGVKAHDIDRFDLPVDVADIIIYGSDFVGTQEEYDTYILEQMKGVTFLPIVIPPHIWVEILKSLEKYDSDAG